MKIMYLTTARHPEDYKNFLKERKVAPNPSNQHFHTKLINLLASEFEVLAFSIRPMEKDLFLHESHNENYYYPSYVNIPFLKLGGIMRNGRQMVTTFKPELIVVDSTNVTLLRLANKLKESFGIKVIAILTDNPMNITGAKKEYKESIFKEVKKCDGFISLTNGLLRIFDVLNKPYFVTPGFIEENSDSVDKVEKYAFFAGALYERYSVKNLIEAFKLSDVPYLLKIAGHGPLAHEISENPHPNIEFLGHISPEEAMDYAKHATLNINPRPEDPQIDLYSVPSKVIDYINSGTITISTKNSEIYNLVADDIYWINDNEPETIKNAMIAISENYSYFHAKAMRAKENLSAQLNHEKQLDAFKELVKKL